MTGGWGTPRKPVLEAIEETADRPHERAKEQPVQHCPPDCTCHTEENHD